MAQLFYPKQLCPPCGGECKHPTDPAHLELQFIHSALGSISDGIFCCSGCGRRLSNCASLECLAFSTTQGRYERGLFFNEHGDILKDQATCAACNQPGENCICHNREQDLREWLLSKLPDTNSIMNFGICVYDHADASQFPDVLPELVKTFGTLFAPDDTLILEITDYLAQLEDDDGEWQTEYEADFYYRLITHINKRLAPTGLCISMKHDEPEQIIYLMPIMDVPIRKSTGERTPILYVENKTDVTPKEVE